MRVLTVLLLSLLTFPAVSAAQADEPRGSVAGMLGGGKTWDDEGGLGNGIAAGGRLEWRLFGTTSIEAALDVLAHERSGGFFESDGHSTIVSASLLHRFGRATVQPYVLGGVHLIHHSGSTRFDDMAVADLQSTDPGIHFGGGVTARINDHLEIGPEARFFIIRAGNDSDPAWAQWIGVRVGFRF